MYICIYIYSFIYLYIYKYICVCRHQLNICTHTYIYTYTRVYLCNIWVAATWMTRDTSKTYIYVKAYGVATISRMLKNIGLFCKRALQKRPVFCKETCIFKHPTHRSHPTVLCITRYQKYAQCNQIKTLKCAYCKKILSLHKKKTSSKDHTGDIHLQWNIYIYIVRCKTL